MDDDLITQLEAAAELQRKATPGPWDMDRDWDDDEPDDSPGHPVGSLVYGQLGQRVVDTDFTTIKSRYGYDAPTRNGAFIAAARNLNLTVVVEELKASRKRLATRDKQLNKMVHHCREALKSKDAEIARLRKRLEDMEYELDGPPHSSTSEWSV